MKTTRSAVVMSVAAMALMQAVRSAAGDSSVSYTGSAYTQNFDSLWTLTTPASNLELSEPVVMIGSSTPGAPIDLTGPSADAAVTIPAISNMTGWYATSLLDGNSVPLNYNVNDGSSKTVALTAYYDPAQQGRGSNFALGALTGSGSGTVVYGIKLVNTTGGSLNAISLSYTGELFHQDTGGKTLTFGYAVDPTGTATLPTSNTTLYGGLNVGGFATGTAGAVAQGAASQESLSVVNLPLSTTWGAGQALWLTWTMDKAGGGQGLAIDNLSFSAANVAGSATLVWATTSGAWDTATANWAGSSTTFTSGSNNASFGSIAGNANITVQAAGVTVPASVTINSGAGTYRFSGGAIGGAAASLIINGGTTILTAANTYGFGTNLVGGTLIVDNNSELGAATAALNFQGGTLALAGNLAGGTRSLTVNSAGGVINTNGFTATFGGATTSITGTLEVKGSGNVNFSARPTFATTGGTLQIDVGASVTLNGAGRSAPSDLYSSAVFNGNLILATTSAGGRFDFNSIGANGNAKITGTGSLLVTNGSGWTDAGSASGHKWQFDTSGAIIGNGSGQFGAEIDVPIVLNPASVADPVGHPFTALNVATANFAGASNPNPTNAFATVIGGTKIGTAGHGPTFANFIVNSVISGNSDVSIGNDYKSGGSGDLTLNGHNTYTGATLINGGGGLYLGVTDALPTTTDVVFGSFSGAGAGSMDLSGHDQHVRSIEVGLGTNSPQSNIINNSGSANATLYITGDNTPFYPYNAQLNDGGTTTAGTTGTGTLALNKSGNGTLIIGEYLSAGHSTTSTYSGGTTVRGGVLQISFDGALGAATGSLTLDGGTLSVQNPLFIGSADGTEVTTALTTDRAFTVGANGGTIVTPSFQATLTVGGTATLVEPVTLSGNGGYHWNGTLQVSGAAGSSVTINGGAGAVGVSGGKVQVNSGATVFAGGSGDPFTDNVNGTAHVGIVSNGLFEVTGGSKAVAGISGTGTVKVDAGASVVSDGAAVANLAINGSLQIRSNGSTTGTSVVSALTLGGASDGWTGGLDLTNNKLIVEATALTKGTALATVQNEVAYGQGHAAGIFSTTLPAGVVVAVVDNGALPVIKGSFGGVATDGNSILVASEMLGDANIDGHVDLNDLNTVLNNLGTTTSAWTSGNFDGAATVDLNDLNAVLNHLGVSFPSGANTVAIAESLVAGQVTATPEPASVGVLALGGVMLMKRWRKQ